MWTLSLVISLLLTLPLATDAISCLVMRPGYGLVTESCPTAAIGCRIKARKEHVEWYEWSKLYDRNQLVCVYPGEYEGTAGCVRKPSGNVRCWCGGTDDCNDAETSQQLVDAFQNSDRSRIEFIIKRLEAGEKLLPTTTTSTPTTARTRPTRPPTRRITHKRLPVHKATKMTPTTATSTTTTTTTSTTERSIANEIEDRPLPTELDSTFDETRRKLNEEMREEDERLQQLLADEEAEMRRDEEESQEQREEMMRRERERNRMERRERARADERRRQTEEDTLRKRERVQKHKETLKKPDDDDYDDQESSSSSPTISLILSIAYTSSLLLLLRDRH